MQQDKKKSGLKKETEGEKKLMWFTCWKTGLTTTLYWDPVTFSGRSSSYSR